jgi:hypothetical protein
MDAGASATLPPLVCEASMTLKPRSLLGGFLVAIVAGCGSDSTGPKSSAPLDLASVVSQLAYSGLASVPGAATLALIPATVIPPAVAPAACPFVAATGFTCPAVTAAGLTFNVSFFLYDASNQPQTQLGIIGSTASVRTIVDTRGTLALPAGSGGGSVAITDHSDNTLSGLQGPNLVINGTSTSHYDVTPDATGTSPVVHSLVDATTLTRNVVFPARGSANGGYPLSGTITSDVSTSSTVGAFPQISVTVHLVLTFDGTSTPTVTIQLGDITKTCKVSLSGQSAPVCS